jgi:uncharacterized membrane protein (DUF373 family)
MHDALIALLALVRKFMVLDAAHAEPLTVAGLAAAILALGAVYWLVREQDRRDASPAAMSSKRRGEQAQPPNIG